MQSRANYHFSPSTGSGTALNSGTALHSAAILFVLTVALTFCSCVPKHKGSARLKVVASVPVIYDWTRNLMNDSDNTNLFLNLIIKNGFNYHNLVPGVTEENLIDSAKVWTAGPRTRPHPYRAWSERYGPQKAYPSYP